MSHAPDWTDSNQSDPGISLLELFAFLAGSYLIMIRLGRLLERTGPAYRLDPADGSGQFGRGVDGAVPPGSVEVGRRYRYGVGAAGVVGIIALAHVGWSLSLCRRWKKGRARPGLADKADT